tara:strand:+ start:4370 stop:5563 length:1194 start_codon:yes stop_codon:yes gene_type:complete
MATVVELGAVEGFILDDPVAGVLDNTTYTLGGLVFKDITDRLISASIARGKNRDLDRVSAGSLTLQLNNDDRAFDPNYASSPFAGSIVPRRELRLTVDGVRQITTTIDDWNFNYNPGGISVAEVTATDDFTLLARQTLTAGTATPQLTGARVAAVLDDPAVDWPADRRNLDAGTSFLGADVFDGNVLQYLQLVSDASEQGQIFMNKAGDVQFRSRLDATPTSTSVTAFADDGTGIPFTLTAVNYGSELLYNEAIVSSAVGTAVASNNRSQIAYGITSVSVDTLVDTTAQLQNLADFLVQKYGDPEYRFETISMNLNTMSAPNKATILGLEIGDVISVKFTPNGLGDPIEQFGQIIRVNQEMDSVRHDVSISVASLDWTFLVLDDAVFGILDLNHLAF